MRSLFRTFEAHRVRYLVISGQACVLYGAAFFSQDLDLWIRPTRSNVTVLIEALRRLKARLHKLTPPLTLPNFRRGHGFHFRVPQPGSTDLFLDIMGQPPRVGGFDGAWKRAEGMKSPWGRLPVVSIEDLVEIKKTNRLADYEVITRLVLIRLDREERPSRDVLRWALRNVFRVEDLWTLLERYGSLLNPRDVPKGAHSFQRIWKSGRTPDLGEMAETSRFLALEAGRLQDRGRAYWLPRIRELRWLRQKGRLLQEGVLVARQPGRRRPEDLD